MRWVELEATLPVRAAPMRAVWRRLLACLPVFQVHSDDHPHVDLVSPPAPSHIRWTFASSAIRRAASFTEPLTAGKMLE
jgi:hypothetical protein